MEKKIGEKRVRQDGRESPTKKGVRADISVKRS